MSDYNSIFTGQEIDNAISLMKNADKLVNGVLLNSGTDLNTLFTPGWYYGLATNSYTNLPITGRNFVLCVFPSADSSSTGERVAQMFITTGYSSTASTAYPSAIYVRGVRRVKSGSSYSSYTTTGWTTLATSTDLTSLSNRIDNIEDSGLATNIQVTSFNGTGNPFSKSMTLNFVPTIIKLYYATSASADVSLCQIFKPASTSSAATMTVLWKGHHTSGITFTPSTKEAFFTGGAGYYVLEAIR